MPRMTSLTGGAAALLLALAPIFSAQAQDQSDGTSSDQAQQESSSSAAEPVTETQLEQFADAHQELKQLRAEYGQKMQNADDKSEKKAVRKEGQQEMVSAIRDSGLKIAEYRQISNKLRSDKELRSRLQSKMQGQQSSGSN